MEFRILKKIFLIVLLNSFNCTFAQTSGIEIERIQNFDNSITLNYKKNIPGTVLLKINFNNVYNSDVTDLEQILTYRSGTLTRIMPIDKNKVVNFGYAYSYLKINPKPKVDSTFQYLLPFKKGKKITIIENDNDSQVHLGKKKGSNMKSYSLLSETADTVCAMRKGIVVEIVNNYKTDTKNLNFKMGEKNIIKIEHPDGTYAVYYGLKQHSFKVQLGDVVYPNTALAVLDFFIQNACVFNFEIIYAKSIEFNWVSNSSPVYWESLTPYFFSAEGNQKIISGNSYTVAVNDGIIQKELTRREIKKLNKK
jgi:ribosomal protein L24